MQPILANRWGFSLLSTILSLIAIALLALATIIWQLPSVSTLADSHLQAPLRIFTQQGDLIAEFGEKQRIPVPLSAIPKKLIYAVISTEDQRFYQHNGVDMISLARAFHSLITTGEKRQGASTITMQVARNFFLSRHKTFLRKFREILLAIKLEQHLTKEQILTLYLNKIYFGMRAYGVATAARNYYGKPLHALTLAEMAMLAGLPQAPSKNNPIVNPTKAKARRNHVLKKMHEQNFITFQEYDNAVKAPITAAKHGPKIIVKAPYAAELTRRKVVNLYGKTIAYNEGLSVYTSIDSNKQIMANQTLFNGLLSYSKRHGFNPSGLNFSEPSIWSTELEKIDNVHDLTPGIVTQINSNKLTVLLKSKQLITINATQSQWALKNRSFKTIVNIGDVIYVKAINNNWQLAHIPKVAGALVSLEPNTGFIKSIVGGIDNSHFNRATQAKRQPGSCFKPFIYAAALDKGYNIASIFNDAPVVMPDSGENLLWRPQNASHKFHGATSLKSGLIHSSNLVSIRILRAIGVDYTRNYITKFGFSLKQQPNSLSLALGSGSTTPLQLTTAYASFANNGFKVDPKIINIITNQAGKIIYQTNLQNKKIITNETAFLIATMLKEVITHGSGRRALVLQRNDIAGKTGTTNNKVDAWFVGFSPTLVTTVWLGYDQLNPLYEFGSQAALPIWIDYMRYALSKQPEHWLDIPEKIIQIKIDPKTGKRSNLVTAKFEYFRNYNLKSLAINNNLEELNNSSDAKQAATDINNLY